MSRRKTSTSSKETETQSLDQTTLKTDQGQHSDLMYERPITEGLEFFSSIEATILHWPARWYTTNRSEQRPGMLHNQIDFILSA
ncbi:hypothetical protein DPMN_100878 [Dreissena polymorpha]|uniref:Uncharacterized protein n=1 Tax=Dreissena polymorpha TaxID=45954 RepID=A0A9D4LID4_DREPO|nr:hypothetical protein DPMN_100878 [Dreissena polymorpha]